MERHSQAMGQQTFSPPSEVRHNDCYLDKLDVELPCEGRHLPLDTQLPLSDAHRDDFIMSRAVPNTIKDVQVLHHNMAI